MFVLCVSLSTLFSSFLTVLLSVCVLFLSGGASVLLSLGLVSWCDIVTDDSTRPYRYTDRLMRNFSGVMVGSSYIYMFGLGKKSA